VGLIYVKDMDSAKAADDFVKKSGLKFDIYNSVVEGDIQYTVVPTYTQAKKLLFIPNVSSAFSSPDVLAIDNFLYDGGSLIVGADNQALTQTLLGQKVSVYMDRSAPNYDQINLATLPQGMSLRAENKYDPNARNYRIGRVAPLDAFNGGQAALAARVMLMIKDPIDTKMSAYTAAVASGNQTDIALTGGSLLNSLYREMRDDEVGGTNDAFTKKEKYVVTDTYLFMTHTLAKTGAERVALLKLAPTLANALQKQNLVSTNSSRNNGLVKFLGAYFKAYSKEINP
jgi:hypothetical protein